MKLGRFKVKKTEDFFLRWPYIFAQKWSKRPLFSQSKPIFPAPKFP